MNTKLNIKLLSMVRKHWNNPDFPREVNRAYQRKWVKSLRLLGDNWALAKYEERLPKVKK
jgi:hypothetical protein